MIDILASSSIAHSLWGAAVASRFDLLMMVVGMLAYALLCSSRSHKQLAKDLGSKEDVTSSVSQVNMADLSKPLSQVLDSMQLCKDNQQDGVEALDAFLDEHPTHPFKVRDVQTILNFCSCCLTEYSWASVSAAALADKLFEHVKPSELDVLNAFLCFYLDHENPENACDIFELNYAKFCEIELDDQTQWRLLLAAAQCGRQSLADNLLQTSHTDVGKNVVTIQRWWKRRSPQMAGSRVAHMGDVFDRLSRIFNERHPFQDEDEEHSDAESTCFLGDDSDRDEDSDDSEWEQM